MTESRPSELIRIKLEFMKPLAGTNVTEFDFKPDEQSNRGDMEHVRQITTLWPRRFSLFMNMDKMVGGDFEKGLTHIKSVAGIERQVIALLT